jgi:hypothetical protein
MHACVLLLVMMRASIFDVDWNNAAVYDLASYFITHLIACICLGRLYGGVLSL